MAKRSNPKRQYPRMARVNELLREVVAEALQDIDDDRLVDVAVTNVQCEADLANAVVHYDVLAGAEADDEVIEALEELRPRLQAIINRETRLKGTPRLTFAPDPVVRSAARIDDVLRGLNASGAPADAAAAGSAAAGSSTGSSTGSAAAGPSGSPASAAAGSAASAAAGSAGGVGSGDPSA